MNEDQQKVDFKEPLVQTAEDEAVKSGAGVHDVPSDWRQRLGQALITTFVGVVIISDILSVWSLAMHLNLLPQLAEGGYSQATSLATSPSELPPVTDLILNEQIMYKTYGMVPPPILAITLKGFLNFEIAILLLIGPELFHGRESIRSRLRGSKVKFSKQSILYQCFGLGSTVVTFGLLAIHTQCWTSMESWHTFSYLISQNSAATTLLVSIANNASVRFFLEAEDRFARLAANVLFYFGMLCAVPLWLAIATALFSTGGILVMVIFSSLLVLSWRVDQYIEREKIKKSNIFARVLPFGEYVQQRFFYTEEPKRPDTEDAPQPTTLQDAIGTAMQASMAAAQHQSKTGSVSLQWKNLLSSCTLYLTTAWFIFGVFVHPLYSILLWGAVVIELLVPLTIVQLFAMRLGIWGDELFLGFPTVARTMYCSFACALCASYLVAMAVPTCILTDYGYFASSAPLIFWGKKIGDYFICTFVIPGRRFTGAADVWWTEFVSWFA